MNKYNVKAYYGDLLRMQSQADGMKMAKAMKRVYMKDYGFKNEEVVITKVR